MSRDRAGQKVRPDRLIKKPDHVGDAVGRHAGEKAGNRRGEGLDDLAAVQARLVQHLDRPLPRGRG